jgi:hypothetical protein
MAVIALFSEVTKYNNKLTMNGEGAVVHELPLFCHLVRIGSYVAPAAGQEQQQQQHNVVLHTDKLELILAGLPKLVLQLDDIRQVNLLVSHLSMICGLYKETMGLL